MANLPADLPEDWTSNQKISPNGTEVGLSEQHGYNYLMKQVNDTQNEVNNIGTTIEAALEDVAKEASVQEVITSIGDTGDTGGSTTLGSVMAKLNATLTKIGEGTTGKTIIAMLEELLTQSKVIKHKQSGNLNSQGFSVTSTYLITREISLVGFTNPNKMAAIITGDWYRGGDNYNDRHSAFLYDLSATTLTIGATGNS
ncbi:MAG: hypothetical protein Q3W84_04155, partial [Eubacteriales bacterium]|nr:hypothetical protein [Eubacteriales bacterium]